MEQSYCRLQLQLIIEGRCNLMMMIQVLLLFYIYIAVVDGFNINSLQKASIARRNLLLYSDVSESEVDTTNINIGESISNENDNDHNEEVVVKPVAKKKVKPKTKKAKAKRPTAREATGLQYRDDEGTYDVPFVDEPKWYRLTVRKSSEKRLTEKFLELKESERWKGIIFDAFYPASSYVKFKGKAITLGLKPMVQGLVYVNTVMSPDIADDIEVMPGIYGFRKSNAGIIVPLGENEEEQIEQMRSMQERVLSPELQKLRKEEYVSVISGTHEGRYGILMGARNGRLEVCLRSDYRDEWDLFAADELRYLAEPPEKKWKTMTAKEAVENLMAKDPKNPTIRSLREQGLLEEILYPDGRPEDDYNNNYNNYSNGPRTGRDGGKRIRSIAKDDSRDSTRGSWSNDNNYDDSEIDNDGDYRSERREKDEEVVYQKREPTTPRVWEPRNPPVQRDYDNRFQRRDNRDDMSRGRNGRYNDYGGDYGGGYGGGYDNNNGGSRGSWSPPSSTTTGGDGGDIEDSFDDFIENLLSDFDNEPVEAAPGGKSNNNGGGGASVTSTSTDRTDSERILEELLGDLDSDRSQRISSGVSDSNSNNNRREPEQRSFTRRRDDEISFGGSRSSSSSSNGGSDGIGDDFDFDFLDDPMPFDMSDSNDKAPRARSSTSRSTSGSTSGSSGGGGGSSSAAPKMEDFGSFEQYLDALVSHERAAGTGSGGDWSSNSKSDADSSKRRGLPTGDDDDLMSLLDEITAGSGSDSTDNGSGKGVSPSSSKTWRSSKPTSGSVTVDMNAGDDDLDSFLSSLDDLEFDLDTDSSNESNDISTNSHRDIDSNNRNSERFNDHKSQSPSFSSPSSGSSSSGSSSSGSSSNNQDLSSLKVPELKAMLKAAGKPVSGKKAELIERLQN